MRVKYRSILAYVVIPAVIAGRWYGTPEAGTHATRHGGLNRQLTRNMPSIGNTRNTSQHVHGAAGHDRIRGLALHGFFQRTSEKTLVSGTTIIRRNMNLVGQSLEPFSP